MPLTNGRGAFSSSLDEYAMDACLQHNKEFVRLEKRWGKFTMGTLRRRTMGFVGFGGIAKETAKLAAPFGLRLIALRRHPQKAAAEQLLTLGQHRSSRLRTVPRTPPPFTHSATSSSAHSLSLQRSRKDVLPLAR